jgi:hypothetical protein
VRMLKNMVLRRIFQPKKDKISGEWRSLHNGRSLIICTAHQILFGDQIKTNEMSGACSTYGGIGEVHTDLW